MADLITAAYAKRRLNQSSFTSDENTLVDELIDSVSKAARRYCRREFDGQQFDELYDGWDQDRLALRQFPVQSVARIAYGPAPVLRITNTSASNQRASVAVTTTGLTLVRVASGVVTTDTSVTFAGNTTLTAVQNAVNALGNGWSATAVAPYASWASADLRAVQGALNAKDRAAELKLHVEELTSYELDLARGWVFRSASEFSDDQGLVFSGGLNYWRVIYTAGFTTVPDDIQEAAAEWVAALFWQSKDNPASYPDVPPAHVIDILDSYRKLSA